MKIKDLSQREITRHLTGKGLPIKIGPFWVNLRSRIPDMLRHIAFFYGEYQTTLSEHFFDFHITLKKTGGVRHWVKPQVTFSLDEFTPFKPLPYNQAFAMFEWGLNWCIATIAHQYLIVHSAVLEKGDRTIIYPGVPGAGKSTLCAALHLSGWRLLSDEMALLDPATLHITPVPRPISLKNQSIDIIRDFSTEAEIGPTANDTAKGAVAHLCPTFQSIQQMSAKGKPYAIIFPKYIANSDTRLQPRPRNVALLEIQENAFNTHVLGKDGFDAVKRLVNRCPVFSLEYSKIDEAMAALEKILIDESMEQHA